MNFLAHLLLADRTATSLAGSILGDVVRGSDLSAYPADIALGVRLHRRIDAATDRHPVVLSAREVFAQGQRRYAGIVLDLAADYALAQDWARHHDEALEPFCHRSGAAIAEAAPWFELAGAHPGRALGFAQLLRSYATEAGIERALERTASRLRDPQGLLDAGRHWQRAAKALSPGLPQLLADLAAVRASLEA